MATINTNSHSRLGPYVTPMAAWAISLGTAIGWGSLVVTSNNYLFKSGPLGSVLGLVVGAIIMLIISRNYCYMIGRYPDSGGSYTFEKKAFGYDHGFLTAWFLWLTYISVFWANATSLPLFARYFFGNIFRRGYMYSIFGYDVYAGEVLLTIFAIVLFTVLSARFKKLLTGAVIFFSVLLTAGITVCFFAAMIKHGGSGFDFEPLFTEKGAPLAQVVKIACITPWAFIGFENISHMSEEFTFKADKVSKILTTSVITATVLYVFITVLSVTAYPSEYASWFEYIKDLSNLEGIKGLPAFYAANYYLGGFGVTMLILTLLALIITSLIGNMLALSRLNYALARDGIIPKYFTKLNRKDIPYRSVFLIGAISLLIPFVGRTAIGWIVDVTTIGATLVYGFVSASAMKIARGQGDKRTVATGFIGMVTMIGFGLYLLIPELFGMGSIERETYFLFTVWTILGFMFFRVILKHDASGNFGRSIVVWIALLSLILFTSLVWLSKSTMSLTNSALESVREYYTSIAGSGRHAASIDKFMGAKMMEMRQSNIRSIMVVTGFFAISIFILMNNYSLMKTRMAANERELESAKNIANLDPLTGVKSRTAFAEGVRIINEEIKAGIISEIGMVACDVNGLKHINDTLGHKAGDQYIYDASRLISDHFVHSPVYRIGGDEFAVILTGNDYLNRYTILQKLNNEIEKAVVNGGVVVSVGLSEYAEDEDSNLEDVMERADALMYSRKKQLKEMGAKTR